MTPINQSNNQSTGRMWNYRHQSINQQQNSTVQLNQSINFATDPDPINQSIDRSTDHNRCCKYLSIPYDEQNVRAYWLTSCWWPWVMSQGDQETTVPWWDDDAQDWRPRCWPPGWPSYRTNRFARMTMRTTGAPAFSDSPRLCSTLSTSRPWRSSRRSHSRRDTAWANSLSCCLVAPCYAVQWTMKIPRGENKFLLSSLTLPHDGMKMCTQEIPQKNNQRDRGYNPRVNFGRWFAFFILGRIPWQWTPIKFLSKSQILRKSEETCKKKKRNCHLKILHIKIEQSSKWKPLKKILIRKSINQSTRQIHYKHSN